ncbi:MAG: hypothetical protein JWN44_703 [Myxococcales bacterium]|nr:hypothetical protein [Myxococcales bacterium]
MSRSLALSLIVVTAFGCSARIDATDSIADGKGDALTRRRYAITADAIDALGGRLASVRPTVRTADGAHDPADYLAASSALGSDGPLGAWGPLGVLGPIGDNSWNASAWISAAGDWSDWSASLARAGGVLGDDGPLGSHGPLSPDAYARALPAINDFAKQLQLGGVWTALGPAGPLGVLGPLGPLGPAGAHGFAVDEEGRYHQGADIVRTIRVPWAATTRTWELFEDYKEPFAKSFTDNDTSFMVEGAIDASDESDSYAFTSHATQQVTLVVVPENAWSDFDLELLDARDRVLATSASSRYIDFIAITVDAGTKLHARVHARSTHPWFPGYRLVVVGSTQHLPASDITGAHQLPL